MALLYFTLLYVLCPILQDGVQLVHTQVEFSSVEATQPVGRGHWRNWNWAAAPPRQLLRFWCWVAVIETTPLPTARPHAILTLVIRA